MSRYNTYTDNLLEYVTLNIDINMLSEYSDLPTEYPSLQLLFDNIGKSYDINGIYLFEYKNNRFVCVMESDCFDAIHSVDDWLLEKTDDFLNALYSDDIYHFECVNDFHSEYIAAKSLRSLDRDSSFLLCVSVDLDYMNYLRRGFMYANIVMYILIGSLLVVGIVFVIRQRIIKPVLALENSTRLFEAVCKESEDLDKLIFDVPELRYDDEIRSLADTIWSMSVCIRSYVKNLVKARDKIVDMRDDLEDTQNALEKVTTIAYMDGLTGVHNKLAYEQYKDMLRSSVIDSDIRFGIVMIDVNYLKRMNDTYGHEKGDIYLKNCCDFICAIFEHSPVFRVGGDEFVVVLENVDYDNKAMLMYKFGYLMHASDRALSPWEQLSMAIGYSDYSKFNGDTVDSVYKRADENMYVNKSEMKATRID